MNIDDIFNAVIKPLEDAVASFLSSWRAPAAREVMCRVITPRAARLWFRQVVTHSFPPGRKKVPLSTVREEEPLFCWVLIWIMDTGTGSYGNSFHLMHSIASHVS